MSLTALAEQLDVLAAQEGALINEGDEYVTVSNLRARATLGILDACLQLGWECLAFDEEQTPTEPENIVENFEPFRITIRKPDRIEGTLDILTSAGFLQWLDKGDEAVCWRVVGLSKPLVTQSRVYNGWVPPVTIVVSPKTKSPRALVKETGYSQIVPGDIRPWLLIDQSQFDFNDFYHKLWCLKALSALVLTLSNEVDPETNSLMFKGPPKLVLLPTQMTVPMLDVFGRDAFMQIHSAASWVYENGREAEIKHSLLSMEIARSGREDGPVADYLKANISVALESAKIAYQMSLSELGKETLKSLGDLRKAITEETAKVTDATRQTITAVSGALAVGVGLVAARLNTDINPWLISIVMLIAVGYITMIVYSGWSFITLQRGLRSEWQPKLYRFLPQEEYKKMVTVPAERSEQVFKYSAAIGAAAVIIMCVGVTIFSFVSEIRTSTSKSNHSGSKNLESIVVNLERRNVQLQSLSYFSLPNHYPFRKPWFSPLSISDELNNGSTKQ